MIKRIYEKPISNIRHFGECFHLDLRKKRRMSAPTVSFLFFGFFGVQAVHQVFFFPFDIV